MKMSDWPNTNHPDTADLLENSVWGQSNLFDLTLLDKEKHQYGIFLMYSYSAKN